MGTDKSNRTEDLKYLIIGVEDGWIKVNDKVWQEYLKAKEVLKNDT